MVVGCPKCKVKLKVDDEKIQPEGLKIKCPKCATMLMVKRPAGAAPAPKPAAPAMPPRPAAPAPKPAAPAAPATAPVRPAAPGGLRAPEGPQPIEAQAKALNPKKILIAHENARIVESAMMELMQRGYLVIPLPNGVDTLVQAMKELPFLVILDAALPKIDGYEIIKRLREKAETKDIKAVIVSSKTDPKRLRKQPASMYGVDAYIDDDEMKGLIAAVSAAVSGEPVADAAPQPTPQPAPAAPRPAAPQAAPAAPRPAAPAAASAAPRPAAPAAAPVAAAPVAAAPGGAVDREAEKAKRLARTVLGDIDLYDPEKVAESIRSGQFETVFAEELREGLKHYQNRIPKEVRARGNFFQESLDEFIAKKKKILGLA